MRLSYLLPQSSGTLYDFNDDLFVITTSECDEYTAFRKYAEEICQSLNCNSIKYDIDKISIKVPNVYDL